MLAPLPTPATPRKPAADGGSSAPRSSREPSGTAAQGIIPRNLADVLEPRSLCYGVPAGPGWADCAFLTGPHGVARSLARVARAHPGASPEVAASYLANWYSAAVVAPAVASYVLLRRVPDLTPARMSLRVLDSGWFDRTALHRPVGTVLADALPAEGGDEHARPPGDGPDRVVGDLAALRGVLVDEVLAHLSPFVRELRARVRLGYPALWGAVAAQCARAFLLTERATGDPEAGRDEADAFFERAAPTMRARPRWHEFVHRGRPYIGMRCGSCCLAHRLGDEYCTTCPFTDDTERERRMRAWIDTQGHGGLAV
ncbi:IucA/IucC family C-terminal-domain containing protein [Frankia sp. QA3]|uniref:IucA/IucC family C-terminal-domain containing protein n=1 Tax=Frankia sp. QA3 TaxID=710111 RepID=UPI000269CB31|nr:IucA/IucC family C-terminal-domain containing protein [Frankia sp. QA3]EIV95248.1 putative Fe-S protein [Frankia sp. QA3]